MSETQWIPGIITLVAGLGLGTMLVLLLRGQSNAETPKESKQKDQDREARIRDLQQQKEQLVAALRTISDLEEAQGHATASEERASLESEAARVFAALDAVKRGGPLEVKPGPEPMGESAATGTDSDSPKRAESSSDQKSADSGLSPELVGMLKGGAFVAFGAALLWSLQAATVPREEGMGITGTAPEVVEMALPVPKEGQVGGPTAGVPKALRAKASADVDAARRQVAATPEDPLAWASLGYALVEAQGWIDVFETSQQIQKMAPEHPDGLVLEAIVRTAMSMQDLAESLIDRALVAEPSHVTGLTYKGMLRLHSGDQTAAKEAWEKALKLAGPGQGFEGLLAMADGKGLPPASDQARTSMRSSHPPIGSGASPAPPRTGAAPSAAIGGQPAYAGQIELAPGSAPPTRGVIFVIARRPGMRVGPPAMTQRLSMAPFPLPFALTEANLMMGGPVPDQVDLSVRLDSDGDPMTRGPEDWTANAGTVQRGTTNLKLVLQPNQ